MRYSTIAAACVVLAVLAGSAMAEKNDAPKTGKKSQVTAQKSTEKFACPMHPDVTSAKAGSCPKCGMALVKSASTGSDDMKCAGDQAKCKEKKGDKKGCCEKGCEDK